MTGLEEEWKTPRHARLGSGLGNSNDFVLDSLREKMKIFFVL